MRRYNLLAPLAVLSLVTLVAACHRASTGAASGGGGAMAKAATPATPAAVTAANVALGDSLFNNGSCQRCHGKGGVGAANGPVLDGKKWVQLATGSFDEIAGIITTGVAAPAIKDPTRRFPMRPRGGPMNLTDPQVQAVAAYVYTLTHK